MAQLVTIVTNLFFTIRNNVWVIKTHTPKTHLRFLCNQAFKNLNAFRVSFMLIHIVAHGAAGISGKKIIFSEFIDFEVCSVRVGIHECCFHDTEPRKIHYDPKYWVGFAQTMQSWLEVEKCERKYLSTTSILDVKNSLFEKQLKTKYIKIDFRKTKKDEGA